MTAILFTPFQSNLTSCHSRAQVLRTKKTTRISHVGGVVSTRCSLQTLSDIPSDDSIASAIVSVSHLHSEITQVADAPTPIVYVSFLALSLAFTVGTYITLSKIKLI
jgi:hypothetical protein